MIGVIDFSNPVFNYRNKGYTSIINQVIDIALEHHKKYKNFNVTINDEQILKDFCPIFNSETFDYNASNMFLENFFLNNTTHNFFNAHTVANKENLHLRKKVLDNILKPKLEVLEESKRIRNLIGDSNVLGIQIRGTDKKNEIPPIPNDVIVKTIREFIKKQSIKKIFLSTDDINYVNLLTYEFGDIIFYNKKNTISYDGNPIHFSNEKESLNREVLTDVYVLSTCEHLIYCFSNVSFLALTLGVDRIKNFKNLNVE
jgi:hypothetical protein